MARAWLSSLRLRLSVDPRLAGRLPRELSEAGEDRGGPVVLVFWHGELFTLLRWARRRPIAALVSRSGDGELLARALAGLGLGAARGSSSRRGAEGLRDLVRQLRRGTSVAVAADGPRGPRLRAFARGERAGAAVAAELGGARVVPLASASSRGWVLPSWDAFELPAPFSTVAVALGSPLEPGEASPARIEAALEATRARAEARLEASGRRVLAGRARA